MRAKPGFPIPMSKLLSVLLLLFLLFHILLGVALFDCHAIILLRRVGRFTKTVSWLSCMCSLCLPAGAMGWSIVCSSGIPWS